MGLIFARPRQGKEKEKPKMKPAMPLYETGNYFVYRAQFGSGRFRPKSDGYEVREFRHTHCVSVAEICKSGEEGFALAKAKADELRKINEKGKP